MRFWTLILRMAPLHAILWITPGFGYAEDLVVSNPISSNTVEDLVKNITKELQPVAITFAAFAVIVVGLKFLIAAVSGNEQKITEARKLLVWVLIGAAVAVGAYAISTAVVNFAKEL